MKGVFPYFVFWVFQEGTKLYSKVAQNDVRSFLKNLVFLKKLFPLWECINIVFSINYEPQPYQTLREAAEIRPAHYSQFNAYLVPPYFKFIKARNSILWIFSEVLKPLVILTVLDPSVLWRISQGSQTKMCKLSYYNLCSQTVCIWAIWLPVLSCSVESGKKSRSIIKVKAKILMSGTKYCAQYQ